MMRNDDEVAITPPLRSQYFTILRDFTEGSSGIGDVVVACERGRVVVMTGKRN
jgi:hypothetical protein